MLQAEHSAILSTFIKLPFVISIFESQKDRKLVFKTSYGLMQFKSIAECSKGSEILSTFIKPPFVISIFEWPFYTGFTVH